MLAAYIAPDPMADSIRPELLSDEMHDALAYALTLGGGYTSAEVRKDATLVDVLHGNGRLVGHAGSTSPCYYKHYDDDDWAIIYHSDLKGDPERGER